MFVVGRLSVRSYEDKQGQKRTKTEVVADDVKFLGGREDRGSSGYTPGSGQYGGGGSENTYDSNKLYGDDSAGTEFSYD